MKINELKIENLRNLALVEIRPHSSLNYFYGANGAGKTSILESLVILSRGRSFRTSQPGELIGPIRDTFRVFTRSVIGHDQEMRLGLERSNNRWRGRKNGQDLTQLSQLTRVMPVVLMEPDSHLIVSGPPDVRRRFLDWGMFHVEHKFLDHWRRYSKALKQRNAALRSGRVNLLDSLDRVLATEGEALGLLRSELARSVSEKIGAFLEILDARLSGISLEYSHGWGKASYLDTLTAYRERDIHRGLTIDGPHRADLVIKFGKSTAKAILSRGEQKTLAAALVLTQADILKSRGVKPLILLDDLASEFDQNHFAKVLKAATQMEGQVWLTGTVKNAFQVPHAMFHVEQGGVEQVV